MTTTHEIGHLLGGWLSGATLTDVELAPWRLPYSLHQPDPHPLTTLWFGPLFGVAAPCVVGLLVRRSAIRFVADFCLLGNGLYLALAWISTDRFLDTQRLLEAGASRTTIVLFCLMTIGLGYVRFRQDCVNELTDYGQNG